MNWYNRQSQSGTKPMRFRATFPIDVFVEDTGDLEANREDAYKVLNQSLEEGLNRNASHGHNYELYLSDLKTDTEVWKS